MSLTIQDLRPYTSLLLARVGKKITPKITARRILEATAKLLAIDGAPGARRTRVDSHVTTVTDELAVGFLHYRERKRPAWLSPYAGGPLDELNQLVLACCWNRYAAVYLSEPGARAAVDRAFLPAARRAAGADFLPELHPFPHGLLNAAFIEDEPLRTLWLRGIHRRTPSKADSKVLTGLDLEAALNPLADQTYYFTAARSVAHLGDDGALTVGVKPRMSRVWAGPVSDWNAFVERLSALLEHLKKSDDAHATVAAPVSVLAAPVESAEEVRDAYDISVIAPEILADEPITNDALLQRAERWAYSSRFDKFHHAADSPNFSVEIALDGEDLGRFDFSVAVGDDGSATVAVTADPPVEDGEESYRPEAVEVCSNVRWLTVRYESGHSISDGLLYSVRHRDVRFAGWDYAPFKDVDVTKEKPTVEYTDSKGRQRWKFAPEKIGLQDSLFCWVQKFWPPGDRVQRGWLACDDGAGEIADFIHFDGDLPGGPRLSLIHVKGSGSGSPNRQISTSDYEVVVGQAVKNLRLLDRINLADQLEAGLNKEVADSVWLDGEPTTRKKMIEALRKVGDNYRRRVVVLQPRVTSTEIAKAERDIDRKKDTPRVARLRQLDTLLVAAQADCAALQADLVVLGQRA